MNLFWLDLETTGLNPKTSKVLEIAMVATTPELEELASETLLVDPVDIEKTMVNTPAKVVEMHEASGLWADLLERPLVSWSDVEPILRTFAESTNCCGAHAATGDAYRSPLCGSNTQFDRAFLRENWPQFERECLHYRNGDVSAIYEFTRRWYPDLAGPDIPTAHRALSDVRRSIELLRWSKRHHFSPHNVRQK